MIKNNKWWLGWVLFGLVSVVLRATLFAKPQWVETIYSRGIFRGVRIVIDYGFAWMPFALMYLFFVLLFLGAWVRWRRHLAGVGWRQRLIIIGKGTLAFAGALVGLFLWMWGYNYGRIPIEQQLQLEVAQLPYDSLKSELLAETEAISAIRRQLTPPGDTHALVLPYSRRELERRVRTSLKQQLTQYGYPVPGRVRGRWLYPKGIFLRFSSAGLYFPYTGEGHIDAGLHPLQWPYTLGHELSHGYGFGDEGVCSFWSYLACSHSADPYIQYMGRLGYWRSLAVYYKIREPEAYAAFRAALPAGMIADLEAINANLLAYPDIAPRLRYQAYDTYLKAQGVSEGMDNYDKVILLIGAWKKKYSRQSER